MQIMKYLLALSVFFNSCVALAEKDSYELELVAFRGMPEFDLRDMNHNGEMYSSASHKDSVFVIEFYFAACPSCNKNAPKFKKMATEFKDNQNIQFIEMSIDCDDDVYARWIKSHQPFVPVLNACDRSVPSDMGVQMFPTTSIVNPSRQEALRGSGEWTTSAYQRIRNYLLQVPKS